MQDKTESRNCVAVVKVRGIISAPLHVRETLKMLNLKRNNYAVLVDNRPSFLGMLKTAQSFVTWGEISKETLTALLKKKGRLIGNKKLTNKHAQKLGYDSLEMLAEAIYNCSVEYWKLPSVQPYFRLHPPIKGFKGKLKKGYGIGGELGYRGEKINDLLERMI